MKNVVASLAALGLVAVVPQSVMAADILGDAFSDCTCVTSPVPGSSHTGRIVLSNGEVLYTDLGASKKARAGAGLNDGAVLATSASGSATISAGASCNNIKVGSNSRASISQPLGSSGDICVKVVSDPYAYAELSGTGGPATASAGSISPWVPLGVAAVVGGVILLTQDDDQDKASK